MALSNIFREPRREITESVIGILVLAPFVVADWYFARWAETLSGNNYMPFPVGLLIGAILLAIAAGVLTAFLLITHSVGEWICNGLRDRGLELRPKVRR